MLNCWALSLLLPVVSCSALPPTLSFSSFWISTVMFWSDLISKSFLECR